MRQPFRPSPGMNALPEFSEAFPAARVADLGDRGIFPFSLNPENRNDVSSALSSIGSHLPSRESRLAWDNMRSGGEADCLGVERQAHAQEIREASAQMASAQIAIYPIDARGLMSGMEATIDDLPGRQSASISETANVRMSDATASQEVMREVARETGGIAYVNQNEIRQGVVAALADSSAYYTVGYYPEDKKVGRQVSPHKSEE